MVSTKMISTTPTKRINWPWKESVIVAEDSAIFDEKRRLLHYDPGRHVLFHGRWYLPAVTVRPVIEVWNYRAISPKASILLDEPKPSKRGNVGNLYRAAGLGGLGGLGGLRAYHAVNSYQQRARVVAILADLVPHAAAVNDEQDAAALNDEQDAELIGGPAPFANFTTKKKIKEYLRTRGHNQLFSLEEFLTCIDLEGCLENLEGRVLEDLVTLSIEALAGLGIRPEHIVQLKKGINYLMDLHDKSFVFAGLPNAAA